MQSTRPARLSMFSLILYNLTGGRIHRWQGAAKRRPIGNFSSRNDEHASCADRLCLMQD